MREKYPLHYLRFFFRRFKESKVGVLDINNLEFLQGSHNNLSSNFQSQSYFFFAFSVKNKYLSFKCLSTFHSLTRSMHMTYDQLFCLFSLYDLEK